MGQLIRCSDVRLINHRIRTVRMRMRAVDAISITFTPDGHSRNRRPLPVRAVMSALGLPRAWAEVYAIRHVFPSGHVAMRNRYRTVRPARALADDYVTMRPVGCTVARVVALPSQHTAPGGAWFCHPKF